LNFFDGTKLLICSPWRCYENYLFCSSDSLDWW